MTALQCPLLLPTDLASLLHDIGQSEASTFGIVQESKGFLEPGLGLAGALLMPGYVTAGDKLVVRAYSTLSGLTVENGRATGHGDSGLVRLCQIA